MADLNPTISAQARARCGAKFLDSKHYGWWNWVDLSRLDMIDSYMCVGGQVERHLSGNGFTAFCNRHYIDLQKLGFVSTLGPGLSRDDTWNLGEAWATEIRARRSSPPPRPKLWWLYKFTHKFTRRERDAEIW